ncbi:hypothetical protein HPC49_26770 [Pyxidicoccus fallax]|uniref:Uncharacterized protein n=2 Tax=Pyxidicoccus fallax TaxID=394095 RepID=A0A848LNX4_9BACT|nr:MXAN_0125 family MYXO-CTERM protein [Pyxidicoccus fallax]NMO19567.1 hypothetical protein [Pyxidicoccus fallax]NPC81808.1 hypothetical protein [Pyxidicoccus fallax]
MRNQRVEPAQQCLIIMVTGSEGLGTVRNKCDAPVTLVDWPIRNDTCQSGVCTEELRPWHEVYFRFADLEGRSEGGSVQDTYQVRFGEEEAQRITVSADVRCFSSKTGEDTGCASAPGALAALGVLLMAGPIVRRRRG